MRRLLFVCPNLEGGGAERQWTVLIPGLQDQGFETAVLTLDGEGRFFDEVRRVRVPAVCARMRGRFDLAGLHRALRLVVGRPDVVVTRGTSAQVVGQLIAWRAGAPHVVTNHANSTALLRRDQRLQMRLVAPYVRRVVAVTRAQLPELEALGYEPDQISVIPNAVEGAALRPGRPGAIVRAELELREQDFLALLVANLRPEKRVDVFVDAVARAHAFDARVRGVVVGGGSEHNRLERLAGETGGAVRLVGPRADVVDLMAAADVVCLSSRVEALPMVVLEAMALARPVVSTAVGGIHEAVGHGETGLLVPPEDPATFAAALAVLAGDPGLARRFGEAGRARQRERFNAGRMVDAYADLLASVASDSHPSSSALRVRSAG